MIVPVRGRRSRWLTVRSGAASLWLAVRAAGAQIGSYLVDALLWFVLLSAAGAALLVAGVYLLVGVGWALIAGGALCIFAASFIRKGMTGG